MIVKTKSSIISTKKFNNGNLIGANVLAIKFFKKSSFLY